MSELKTLQTLLAEKQKRIKEIEARIASIEGMDKPEVKPIKAWLATDKDGLSINFYTAKPFRENSEWWGYTKFVCLSDYLPFQAPKWEDEPVEVEITIKKV